MSIQIANDALENCTSIVEVVELVNDEFATDATAEMIAAAYAIDGAEEAGYGLDDANLEAQLDALAEAGADFDCSEALDLAKKSVKQ